MSVCVHARRMSMCMCVQSILGWRRSRLPCSAPPLPAGHGAMLCLHLKVPCRAMPACHGTTCCACTPPACRSWLWATAALARCVVLARTYGRALLQCRRACTAAQRCPSGAVAQRHGSACRTPASHCTIWVSHSKRGSIPLYDTVSHSKRGRLHRLGSRARCHPSLSVECTEPREALLVINNMSHSRAASVGVVHSWAARLHGCCSFTSLVHSTFCPVP